MDYWVILRIGEKPKGPYGVDEVMNLPLSPESLVWHKGINEWRPATSFDEFKALYEEEPDSEAPVAASDASAPSEKPAVAEVEKPTAEAPAEIEDETPTDDKQADKPSDAADEPSLDDAADVAEEPAADSPDDVTEEPAADTVAEASGQGEAEKPTGKEPEVVIPPVPAMPPKFNPATAYRVQPQQPPHFAQPPTQQPQPQQPAAQQPQQSAVPECPPTHLVWSIIFTILCCSIFGIVGIVFSVLTRSRYNSGNYKGAQKASEVAEWMCILSFTFGLVMWPLVFVI